MTTDIANIIRRNKEEYTDAYDTMKWVTPEEIKIATLSRNRILNTILKQPGAKRSFSNTKLYTHRLSPGCRLCGQGEWSCLFINGICNAGCFYCPSAQKDNGPPGIHALSFEHPENYVEYVNRFRIRGVSFSGGEPFLSFDRVVAFLKALRAGVRHPLYVWIYTNGILGDQDKFLALKDAGLDEIRFDLSADDYRLSMLKKAAGIIPCVTVEIPAIPEDLPRTKQLLQPLYDSGVDYLNLHQIRCTPFNRENLSKRGYTFIHGPKVTVLETELTALELIRYALERDINLPINYCAFTYRHQFQGAGARKRYAPLIKADWEDITATGHIRQLKMTGETPVIEKLSHSLSKAGAEPERYSTNAKKNTLFFSAKLWPLLNFSRVQLNIAYYTAAARPSVSCRFAFKSIPLSSGKSIVIEKQPAARPIVLQQKNDIKSFGRLLDDPSLFLSRPGKGESLHALAFEAVSPGLSPYM